MPGDAIQEMFRALSTRQDNGGQGHLTLPSSDLIHNLQGDPAADQLSTLPRSELRLSENNFTNPPPHHVVAIDDSTFGDRSSAQDPFPPLTLHPSNQVGSGSSLNLNQDLNFGQQEQRVDDQLNNGPSQGFDLNFGFGLSLMPSHMEGAVDLQLPVTQHAQQQQSQPQPPLSNFIFDNNHNNNNNMNYSNCAALDHLRLDSSISFRKRFPETNQISQPQQNSIAFSNNGVTPSQFIPPSRPQEEIPLFAQPMGPNGFYATGGASSSEYQLLSNNFAQPQQQMQMTWPEIIQPSHNPQQSQWVPHVHGTQLPNHRVPPNTASRRSYPTNSLYDPAYESMGLPVDPFMRLFLSNPNFANRRQS